MNYVTGYTEFSSKESEQSGNYLALKFTNGTADSTVTVEVVNGTKGPVTLDADMNIVLLIRNKDTQSIRVTITKGGDTASKTYSLTGLTLKPSA